MAVTPLTPQPLFEWRETKRNNPTWEVLRRLARNRASIIGLVVLVILVVIAVGAPVWAPYDPIKIYPENNLRPPSVKNPMGTDNLGRDVFSRIIFGARLSLIMGIIAVVIATVTGTIIGLISGYTGGWVDSFLMRLIDVMMAMPGILMALVVVAVLGPSLVNVMVAVGISWIPSYARLARSSVLSVKEQDYVTAALVLGCSSQRIMTRHILPNIIMPIIIFATLGIAGAILMNASLNFLGLGAQPPTPEWGAMLNEAQRFVRRAWWWTTFPGVAIMITVMSFSLLGDGLRDALDPRLKI